MNTETEGIVLKQIKTVNGRRMILLFSKRFGKISAGTGINEKSRRKSSLAMRPFSYGRYDLFKGHNSFNINSGELIESYYKIGEDIDRYMSCAYVLEFTEKVITENAPNPGLFNLLLDFLRVMDKREKKFGTVVAAYQIKAFKHLGIMPGLDKCVLCGKEEEPFYFSIKDGGIICDACFKDMKNSRNDTLIYPPDFGIVDIIKYFSNNSLRSLGKLALEKETLGRLSDVLKAYIDYHLDIGVLKSEGMMEDY